MRKQIKLFILIIALTLMIYIPISYAIEANFDLNIKNDLGTVNQEQNKLDFFTVDSREKQVGETLNMYINLSQLDYDVSKFTLTSSSLLNNINSEEVEIKKENNEFSLIINKNELNIDQIILTYIIPNNFKVGDKFTLTGRIYQYKEESLEDKKEDNLQENIESNNQKQVDKENIFKEIQIEITITEKKENGKEVENLKDTQNLIGQMQNNIQSTIKYNTMNFSNTETVIYNGSRNNYLETLSIVNYELNTEFSKENTTYFLTVPNDVVSINITTTKEDSSSTVCIYGDDNLKVGVNKVLITVTAENGDVRNYRIFVDREA